MADPSWALQQVLYSEVTAAGLTVRDGAAEEGQAYPFVTIGADVVDDFGSKDIDGWSFGAQLQCWSSLRDFDEVKGMVETIRGRINRNTYTQDSFRIYQVREASVRYLIEEDGHGRRAVIEYLVRVAPVI